MGTHLPSIYNLTGAGAQWEAIPRASGGNIADYGRPVLWSFLLEASAPKREPPDEMQNQFSNPPPDLATPHKETRAPV
ncbi:hypothetical protein CTA1_11846 [Colletotrichum tanaceti]|uniref:Uncharacterized protein n=1 Tax=Colletotrichum tanaceti TaxID=1306861 RepID=A0A4U6XBS9_9PEZI|nr:hypothetical protein CTA1_11846 [Colletotrichum tanaceti]